MAISGSNGYTGGGLDVPYGIAIDSSGAVWITNNGGADDKLSNAGAPLSGTGGFTGGGAAGARQIAIDGAGNAWTADFAYFTASEFSNSGVALSPSGGFQGGGALYYPAGIAIDGSGNAWMINQGNLGSLAELVGVAVPVITPICAGLPATPTANGTSNLGTRP